MPVLLSPEAEEEWLDPEASVSSISKHLRPAPEDLLEAYEVSRAVDSPKNDVPECIRRLK